MTRVLIHTDTPQRHLAKLTEAYPQVQAQSVVRNSEVSDTLNQFAPDVMFSVNHSSDAAYPSDAVRTCKSLKWLSVGGSGTDHIAPWSGKNLRVTNSAGVSADIMAEYILGCFFHFNLDVPGLQEDQNTKTWVPTRAMIPLAGQTVLIVGLGHTGQALAQKAKALGMSVLGTRANPRNTPHCDEVHGPDRLPQLWPRADYIAICTPRLPATLGLVSEATFDMTKPNAVLVNVSRGNVVDETALLNALWAGKIRGAAMDVFATEPLREDDPIWDAPNLLISPHCSGVYKGWEDASFARFLTNLGRFLKQDPLHNIVDPNRGY
ncbi:MAG: D-2-hydroxyacid dehydrogenase [Paracoccaceae bacterium]